jgi:small subunit ribosomal protein S4
VKKQRKKYEIPLKPWSAERIAAERKLLRAYGLRKKQEIWRAESVLRNFRRLARTLVAKRDKAAEAILLTKLQRLGLIKPGATLDDVLALTIEKVLDRRLQTIVFKKGIAATHAQARQFIVHGHIAIAGRRARWPSQLVLAEEEDKVTLHEKSKLRAIKALIPKGK